MIQTVARGDPITLDVQFINQSGQLEDADPVRVDIIDPNDVEAISNASPTTHTGTGLYSYTYTVADDAPLGLWGIRWAGVMDEAPLDEQIEYFQVVAASAVIVDGQTFATVAELAAYLGTSIEPDDEHAQRVLLQATALIQSEACHRIFYVEDETKRLRGTWASELVLPEAPVVSVSAVSVGDTDLTEGSFEVTRWGALRSASAWLDSDPYWLWGGSHAEITVTYSHGYVDVPEDIKAVCLSLAGRAFENPTGVSSESIGSYSYSNGSSPDGMMLTSAEKAICRRYRPQ